MIFVIWLVAKQPCLNAMVLKAGPSLIDFHRFLDMKDIFKFSTEMGVTLCNLSLRGLTN